MPRKRKSSEVDREGFLDPRHWAERFLDQACRDALFDALAVVINVPGETITEIYVALLLDVFGSWHAENPDRFRPYAIGRGRGRSLANETRFSTIVIDEIPEIYPPFRQLIDRYTLPLVLASLILYEIDSLDGSITTILKAHVRLLKARMPQVGVEVATRAATKLLRRLQPTLRDGRMIAASRRLGGQKTGEILRERARERNARICTVAKRLALSHKSRDIPSILSKQFDRTPRQIRSILKTCKEEEMS